MTQRHSREMLRLAVTGVLVVGLSLSPAFAQKKPGRPATEKPKSNLPTRDSGPAVTVTGVDPQRRDAALSSAKKIDRYINDALAGHKQAPNPPTTDEQFVRRAYLVITGTIPTAAQAEAYVKQTGSNKRIVLADQLLGTSAHASHMYNAWADTLRLVDDLTGNNYLSPYREWVKDAVRSNMPYDEFVKKLLTAEGHIWDDPAAGYALRDAGMPLDNLNNTVRVFLGTQIGCAQCHDHPFDKWTQKEFYELAAFVAGTEYRGNSNKDLSAMISRTEPKKVPAGGWYYSDVPVDSPDGRTAQALLRANRHKVSEDPNEQLKYPADYAYDNAKPNSVAKPAVIFGNMPTMQPGQSRREAFADWLASADNPRFARTIANRLWKQVFGVGLIEPVDDMRDDTAASIPELLTFLEQELVRLDFNQREFMRILYYTDAFQRQAVYEDIPLDQPFYFQGPALRRLSAEQVWDSLLTLTLDDPYRQTFDYSQQLIQAVSLSDAKTTSDVQRHIEEYRAYQSMVGKERNKATYKGQQLLPASELRQPLPDAHFLRQFGLSDREQIDDSTVEGSVPQLLAMFNGFVTHMMLEEGSVIHQRVTSERTESAQIDAMFWSLLSRRPTAEERTLASKEMKAHGRAGYGNVIWALLNTREFLFIQ